MAKMEGETSKLQDKAFWILLTEAWVHPTTPNDREERERENADSVRVLSNVEDMTEHSCNDIGRGRGIPTLQKRERMPTAKECCPTSKT